MQHRPGSGIPMITDTILLAATLFLSISPNVKEVESGLIFLHMAGTLNFRK